MNLRMVAWGRKREKVFAPLALLVTITGCNANDLPDLAGRFQGTQGTGSATSQVVAQLPTFVDVNRTKVLRFHAYPTLGSSVATDYQITAVSKQQIVLSVPSISRTDLILAKNGNCASGTNSGEPVKLCWDTGKLDLTVGLSNQGSFSLHIKRDDSLPPLDAQDSSGRTYNLDELVGRAKFYNYTVSQEAERVFQARENIAVARGNLLPKLSLRAVVGIFTGDYLSVVGNALPFLFPSNWFKWKASKEMAQAERKSYASLRGNEMNAVEGLYYLVLRDQAVLTQVDQHIAWMKRTQDDLSKEEQAGTLPAGSADYFGTSVAQLARDRIGLNTLIQNEYGELAHAVALPVLGGISQLAPIDPPSLDGVQPIQPQDFYRDAQIKSYEVKAIDYLVKAAQYLTTDVFFEFLDPEGGGSIGFGTAAQFRIGKSRQNELRKKSDETYSLVEQKSVRAANEYNSALDTYGVAQAGLAATQRRLDWLMQRHINGDGTLDEADFINQLIDLEFKILGFNADKVTSIQAWQMSKAKIQRLLLQGFYQNLEDSLPGNSSQADTLDSARSESAPAIL